MSFPLPNFRNAILDIRKLRDYCLNSEHFRGGHKARVFRAALAIDDSDAVWLRQEILQALPDIHAAHTKTDYFGLHYSAKITLTRQSRTAVVITKWIIRHGEDFPRFLSAWVL